MLNRLRTLATEYALDLLTIAGLALVAYGAWHMPGGWGEVAGPAILGLGLIATVRLGSR